ncbi:collagen alpha-5(VI) chain-like isoform X1 [Clavelina lepadiformis]|uniref:collagen alpha-5(VI) chain-like isoform X1 n=1 Tax=Clavelina lepadiformis TaxID=159417 RepID=UPI004041E4A4
MAGRRLVFAFLIGVIYCQTILIHGGEIDFETARDVVFLLDKSGSIGSTENMQVVKDMAAAIVHVICGAIEVSSDKTRVAVALFDNAIHRHIEMNQYVRPGQKAKLETAIKQLRISPGGSSSLNVALENARRLILHDTTKGARYGDPRVKRTTFVITDGCATSRSGLTPKQVRDNYVADGSCIVLISIGNHSICRATLQAFDTNCLCFQQFFFSSFADARSNFVDIINNLPEGFCAVPTWDDLLPAC